MVTHCESFIVQQQAGRRGMSKLRHTAPRSQRILAFPPPSLLHGVSTTSANKTFVLTTLPWRVSSMIFSLSWPKSVCAAEERRWAWLEVSLRLNPKVVWCPLIAHSVTVWGAYWRRLLKIFSNFQFQDMVYTICKSDVRFSSIPMIRPGLDSSQKSLSSLWREIDPELLLNSPNFTACLSTDLIKTRLDIYTL